MASAIKPPLRQYKSLPIFIEEDHNDVVPHIHRAIASHHLPMAGVTMVHFDSHPDLLLPLHMQADNVFDKDKLYSDLSIENWILPLAYAGHISEIYWLKPPWADQLHDTDLTFSVGKWKQTGEIRMTLDNPYFLTEALYVPESQLSDVKRVTLHVITVKPHGWTDCEGLGNPGNRLKQTTVSSVSTDLKTECVQTGKRPANNVKILPGEEKCRDTGPAEAKCAKLDLELVEGSALRMEELTKLRENSVSKDDIVQIRSSPACGDTHDKCGIESTPSTRRISPCSESECSKEDKAENSQTFQNNEGLLNQSWLTEVQKKLKGRPYILDVDLDFYSTKDPFQNECSPEQTALLHQLFEFKIPEDKSEQSVFEFSQARAAQLDELNDVFQQLQQQPDCTPSVQDPHRQKLLDGLVSLLRSDEYRSAPVDYGMLYHAGCTFDGTSLPHHVSSSQQIHQLMDTTGVILRSLPKPTIVTVSRSSVDDYCPQHQVEAIQESMLKVFTDVYGNTDVNKMYEEQQQG